MIRYPKFSKESLRSSAYPELYPELAEELLNKPHKRESESCIDCSRGPNHDCKICLTAFEDEGIRRPVIEISLTPIENAEWKRASYWEKEKMEKEFSIKLDVSCPHSSVSECKYCSFSKEYCEAMQ